MKTQDVENCLLNQNVAALIQSLGWVTTLG